MLGNPCDGAAEPMLLVMGSLRGGKMPSSILQHCQQAACVMATGKGQVGALQLLHLNDLLPLLASLPLALLECNQIHVRNLRQGIQAKGMPGVQGILGVISQGTCICCGEGSNALVPVSTPSDKRKVLSW